MKKYVAYIAFVALVACEANDQSVDPNAETEAVSAPSSIGINAAEFISASEGVVSDSNAIQVSGEGWATYQIDVPEPGRYKFRVEGSSSNGGAVWIEDYIDNKDERTYNVTSRVELDSAGGARGVDGSPLNAGVHNIKLHVDGDAVVHGFSFELMKAHQFTPEVLTQDMSGETWEVVWSDEFDQDGLPDTTKWIYDVGNWGWGNGELQYYTEARRENAYCENGLLTITAIKDDLGYPWTSTRLTTRGKTAFVYGKIEFRAKVPANKGNWAAGWTLGDKYVDELSWPYCGEIDILESVGYEMDDETGNGKAHASAHCGAYYFKLGNQPTGIIDVASMEKDFHTYAVVWTEDGITAYVDDNEYFHYDDTSSDLSWPFSDPQNIILNLAMGGGWGGLEGMDPTVQTQEFIIDYVRVYQKK